MILNDKAYRLFKDGGDVQIFEILLEFNEV